MKATTTIRIEKELIQKAQKYGVNLSKTVENLLKIYIETIEQNYNKIQKQTETISKKEGKEGFGNVVSEWACPDSNRGPSPREGDVLTN